MVLTPSEGYAGTQIERDDAVFAPVRAYPFPVALAAAVTGVVALRAVPDSAAVVFAVPESVVPAARAADVAPTTASVDLRVEPPVLSLRPAHAGRTAAAVAEQYRTRALGPG